MQKSPIVIIGLGEMAGVFARGFLRLGHPVYPVTRDTDTNALAAQIPDPALALLAVGENDLHSALDTLPAAWRPHLGLLQNELLPRDWEAHDLSAPTVISVWFEKKKGQDYKVLIPSPVYGAGAQLIADALGKIDIPSRVLADAGELAFELVLKNVYILTTNIAGLISGGTVSELWREHEALARAVASDVMDIQAWLTHTELDREQLIDAMLRAFDGDPEHKCMGRSAPARLERALRIADEAGLDVPTLRDIQARSA